jgi:cell division protein ZapA
MAQVTIDIHGRSYAVGCADGEEERVKSLASYVDAKLREIAASAGGGGGGEARLLALTCLTLADELADAYGDAEREREGGAVVGKDAEMRAETAEAQKRTLEDRLRLIETRLNAREDALVGHIEKIATQLNDVAKRLSHSSTRG